MSFSNAPGSPWVWIALVTANQNGNRVSDGKFTPQFNQVEMVCSDGRKQDWYEGLAVRIAEFLGWTFPKPA